MYINLDGLMKGADIPYINSVEIKIGSEIYTIDRQSTTVYRPPVEETDRLVPVTLVFNECYIWDGENEKPADRLMTDISDKGFTLADIDIEDDSPEGFQFIPTGAEIKEEEMTLKKYIGEIDFMSLYKNGRLDPTE